MEWIRSSGSDNDWGYDVAVDGDGNTYITGATWSADLPSVGGMPPDNAASGEAFVQKLGPDLQTIYTTFFGSPSASDYGEGIAVDAQGQAVVAGSTHGSIAEVSAAHPGRCATDAGVTGFLAKLAVDGASFRYSTCVPANSAVAVALSPSGEAVAVGETAGDVFIGRYSPPGLSLFGTQWGGSSGEYSADVALDASGHAFVAGRTSSSDLPDTAGALQPTLSGGGFVAKFSPVGSPVRATYLGGSGQTRALGIAVDHLGDVYVTGTTFAADFPLVAASRSELRQSPWGPVMTAFLAKFQPDLDQLVYSTFYVHEGVPVDGIVEYVDHEEARKVAVDRAGNAYLIGYAQTFNSATYFADAFSWLAGFEADGQPSSDALLDLTANGDEAYGVAVADDGQVYVVGHVDYLWGCEWVEGVGQVCSVLSDSDVFIARFPGASGDEILLLPETTRWKAQKDTSASIEIAFASTTPLASAVVNVTGPATVEPLQATFDPANPPDPYRVTWSGLDNSGRPLPAGDYTINIVGQPESGAPLNSSPPDHVVSLVEVTAETFRLERLATNPPLGENPGAGGGLQIFPEAGSPHPHDEVGDMDKVMVAATTFPVVSDPGSTGPVTVYFRGIDVDDPSANTAPVDDETLVADNCRGGGCQVPPGGRVNGIDAGAPVPVEVPIGQAEFRAVFQVSQRQGDNYRLAASTSRSWLAGLSAQQNSTNGEVIHASGEPLTPGTHITEMLTVWRTLHLEVDVMQEAIEQLPTSVLPAGVAFLDVLGQVAAVTTDTLTADGQPMLTPDHGPAVDQWHWADLWPSWAGGAGAGPLMVKGSTGSTLRIDKSGPDLSTHTQPGAVFRLSDDRKDAFTTTPVALGLTRQLLASAYIRLDDTPAANTTNLVNFIRNLQATKQRRLPRDIESSEAYWAVLLVKAFDAPVDLDHDPNDPRVSPGFVVPTNERARLATTTDWIRVVKGLDVTGPLPRQPVVAFFPETTRDWNAVQRVTDNVVERNLAHEVLCHTLGNWGGHASQTVCGSPFRTGPAGAQISDDHRAVLRTLRYPTLTN